MDVRLVFDPEVIEADIALLAADLETDEGLETALIISLFTDARADPGEIPGDEDPRGYWGDGFAEVEGDRIGSKLWILEREKLTEPVRVRAEAFAREATTWFVADGIATKVEVSGEIVSGTRLDLLVTPVRPDGTARPFRFQDVWRNV